ncbi:hypothetical protein GCM10027084_07220 [Pseudoxanthomonas sangjuensis]
MRDEPRVAFTGYYGMRNFGDDLFGVLCAAAARRFWNAAPRLIGPPLAGLDAPGTWPRALPRDWYGGTGIAGRTARLLGFARGLRGSDVLVLGGGSVINARRSFRTPLMRSAQRRGRLRLAALGVSIGPFPDAAAQAAAARNARAFSYIAVRDRRSFELAQAMGLGEVAHDGRDLAGLLPLLFPRNGRDGKAGPRTVGIAPCRYAVRDDHPAPACDAWLDACVDALAGAAAPLRVRVFCLNSHPEHGDEAIATRLHARLRERGVDAVLQRYDGRDPLATVGGIADCDAFISARLHGAIVSYLCGVPFTMVEYHPKCRDFADDIGLDAACRITSRWCGRAAFADAIATMLNEDATPVRLSPDLYARQALGIFQCAPWSISLPPTIAPMPRATAP